MSEQPAKRKYTKITEEHREYAEARFADMASTATVQAELRARGGDYAYNALRHYFKKAEAARKAAREAA